MLQDEGGQIVCFGSEGEALNLVLPRFVRLSWVSDTAREVWAGRFQRIFRAWSEIEWKSVTCGVRTCGIVEPSDIETDAEKERSWRAFGLTTCRLEDDGGEVNSSSRGTAHIAVGLPTVVVQLEEAWKARDHGSIGRFLGYPACCCRAFQKLCVSERWVEPIWQMVAEALPSSDLNTDVRRMSGYRLTNIFLRSVGIRGVPHLPCGFDCNASVMLGRSFMTIGIQSGFEAEIDWLEDILSWPVEWNGLHGIAEVRTPLFKICTLTNPVSGRRLVRWTGQGYPLEGARGLAFPYQVAPKRIVTQSQSFNRGLVHIESIHNELGIT